MIKVAILGYGTIGTGVAQVLKENQNGIAKRTGDKIEVAYILDLRSFEGLDIPVVSDFSVIVSDPEVDIVVEAMGGVEPAYTFAKQTLSAGKHFVTSNKALVAVHGPELIRMAREHSVNFLFEASVGGGIPIIRPINTSLTSDTIEEITGILNGTTNYMMSKMSTEGLEFDDVLKDAQEKGFAEADPTADIEGHDAGRKIAILTSLVCEKMVEFEQIHTEGITKISATDIKYANAMGRRIKLLGTSRRIGESYCALVAPFLLNESHPLYSVNEVFNAIYVEGNMLGPAMFYGQGAGSLPTASAVVSDVIDCAKHLHDNIPYVWSDEKMVMEDYRTLSFSYFIRTRADQDKIKEIFSDVEFIDVGIEKECAFITEKMDGFAFESAIDLIPEVLSVIRME